MQGVYQTDSLKKFHLNLSMISLIFSSASNYFKRGIKSKGPLLCCPELKWTATKEERFKDL